MIPGRRDYNLIGTEEDPIPELEPVFILRGQDEFAELAVRIYGLIAFQNGCVAVGQSALQVADLMRVWPTKKRPDL